MIEDDAHDMLVKAYLSYFTANEKFEARESHRTHAESRKWLRAIRKHAKIRGDEINDKYKAKKAAEKGK